LSSAYKSKRLVMHMTISDVRLAGFSDHKRWNDYVTTHKNGFVYHLFEWKKAIEAAYGFDCPYFILEHKNRIRGIMPTAHIRLPFGRGRLVSQPYCDVGGALTDEPEMADSLFAYVSQYARQRRISEIEIRDIPEFPPGSEGHISCNGENTFSSGSLEPSVSGKVRMLLDLPKDSEELLSSFKSKLRSQIRKPIRDGLTAEVGGKEMLAEFYSVFAENMRALGSPTHSMKWLDSVLTHFGDKAKCGMVYMPDKTPAAGGIILCHNKFVSIPWASSVPRLNRFNPNMLLYWTFLKFAADNGYRYFDFGRSTPNEGTYKFKAQWGAKSHPLIWKKWEIGRNGVHSASAVSNFHSNSRIRPMAATVIQHTPLPFATFLGSRIRKYISL